MKNCIYRQNGFASGSKQVLCLLAMFYMGACTKPMAEVQVLQPTVNYSRDGQSFSIQEKQSLVAGDIVKTGDSGRARLFIEKTGDVLELEPGSTVLVSPAEVKVSKLKVDFQIVQGKVSAKTTGKSRLLIGTPFGVAQVAADGEKSEFLMDMTEGAVAMQMGDVTFVDKQGASYAARFGDAIRLGMGEIEVVKQQPKKEKQDLGTLEPLVFVVQTIGKDVHVRSEGEKAWKKLSHKDELKIGDIIRTGKKGSTVLTYAPGATVTIAKDSQVRLIEAKGFRNKESGLVSTTKAALEIEKGKVEIDLEKLNKKSNHEMVINNKQEKIEIKATGKKAQVEIQSDEKQGSQIAVYSGSVELKNGKRVEAGRVYDLKTGKLDDISNRYAGQLVMVDSGRKNIYYPKVPPPVSIHWDKGTNKEALWLVEIAQDKGFSKVIQQEQITADRLYVAEHPGHFFWRVRPIKDAASKFSGLVSFERKEFSASQQVRKNIVRNTGELTAILYQARLPRIELQWKSIPDAVEYELLVYPGDDFDNPLMKQKTKEVKQTFERGDFVAGQYFWYVSAFDVSGKKLKTTSMNELVIRRDQSSEEDFEIAAPKPYARVPGSKVVTKGTVSSERVSLTINDTPVEYNEEGAFWVTLKMDKGRKNLIYRLKQNRNSEKIYVVPVRVR